MIIEDERKEEFSVLERESEFLFEDFFNVYKLMRGWFLLRFFVIYIRLYIIIFFSMVLYLVLSSLVLFFVLFRIFCLCRIDVFIFGYVWFKSWLKV